MRFVFLSRDANRAGFFALEHLLQRSEFVPSCVILPSPTRKPAQSMSGGSPLDLGPIPPHAYNHHQFTNSIPELARQHGVPVEQVEDINAFKTLRLLERHAPELIVVGGGWPQLLRPNVIACASRGAINAHPSLLPEFRGTDVHRWQIFHGVRVSGTTIHMMEQVFDTGRILTQDNFSVSPDDTPQALAEKSALVTGPLLEQAIGMVRDMRPGHVLGHPQGEPVGQSSFPRWPWQDLGFLRIRWSDSAARIERLVLSCTQESYYYNGPYANCGDQPVIIRQAKAEVFDPSGPRRPGRVVEFTAQGPLVECGTGAILLTEVQPASEAFWPEGFHTAPAIVGHAFGGMLRSAGIDTLN